MKELSICIPTYNRFPFLQWTLDRTVKDFPDAKIVVSDNASTDETAGNWKVPGRYIRQSHNIGAFPNMRAALLSGHTKYVVFLGDDDYLIPEELAKGIEFMEKNPTTLIYYAPCQLYNEIEKKPDWDAFYIAQDETFSRADTLWNFVMHRHVWPEHAIYRRDKLEEILQPRVSAYWCFVDLANAALRGPIHFASTPYYRNLTAHPVGGRVKLGDQQCLTDFDAYTAGLQVLAHDLFNGHLDQTMKSNLNNMIRLFIWSRFEVANRILMANNRIAEASILQKRMAITSN